MNSIAALLAAGAVAFGLACPSFALAQALPNKIGQCVRSKVTDVSTRLERTPGSGSSVSFANGLSQMGYETLPAIENSKLGDPVLICLVDRDRNCPKGYRPTSSFTTTNLRTQGSWTLGDSSHSC